MTLQGNESQAKLLWNVVTISNHDPYLVLKSSLFSSYLPHIASESLMAPGNQNRVPRFHFCFIYINHTLAHAATTCVFTFFVQIAKQVICPIAAAHGGADGPFAARHVRKSRARSLWAGRWFFHAVTLWRRKVGELLINSTWLYYMQRPSLNCLSSYF